MAAAAAADPPWKVEFFRDLDALERDTPDDNVHMKNTIKVLRLIVRDPDEVFPDQETIYRKLHEMGYNNRVNRNNRDPAKYKVLREINPEVVQILHVTLPLILEYFYTHYPRDYISRFIRQEVNVMGELDHPKNFYNRIQKFYDSLKIHEYAAKLGFTPDEMMFLITNVWDFVKYHMKPAKELSVFLIPEFMRANHGRFRSSEVPFVLIMLEEYKRLRANPETAESALAQLRTYLTEQKAGNRVNNDNLRLFFSKFFAPEELDLVLAGLGAQVTDDFLIECSADAIETFNCPVGSQRETYRVCRSPYPLTPNDIRAVCNPPAGGKRRRRATRKSRKTRRNRRRKTRSASRPRL